MTGHRKIPVYVSPKSMAATIFISKAIMIMDGRGNDGDNEEESMEIRNKCTVKKIERCS